MGKSTEARHESTDAWHSDKWEMFFKTYRPLSYSEYQSTDFITGSGTDNPEIELDESITKADNSENYVDIKAEREIKRGYNPDAGYYYNYIAIDMFSEQSKTFILHYEDLQNALSFGISPVKEGFKTLEREDIGYIDEQVRFNPEAAAHGIKNAVYKIMKETHHEYAMELKDEFKARFEGVPTKIALSDITNKNVGHLYSFEGFVTAVDEETRLQYQTSMWTCGAHNTEVQGRNKPAQCKYCDKRYLEPAPDGITETYQEFRLQQRPDQTRDGRMAVEREVVLIGDDIVNSVQGGDYVELTGIVKVRENQTRKKNNDIVDFYIEASYLERKPDDAIMILVEKDSLFLENEVKDAVHEDTEELDFDKLRNSVAPSVMGHEIVKEAVLLQMAASDEKTFEDGTPHRGHICILFCGSPATAKTVIANYARKVHPRGIMPTGIGLTVAGLTATVDMKTSPPRLHAGAYPMAKNGIVVIDEMQALSEDALSAILEAIEDAQTITITKAGIHRPLKADCASLHLSNPKKTAYWDDTKNIMENTGFKANLLSRYDSIIVFRDIPDPEEDEKKIGHWLKNYANARTISEDLKEKERAKNRIKSKGTKSGLHSLPYMAMWLRYVRKTFHPVLDPKSEAFNIIQKFYLDFRKIDTRHFAQVSSDPDEEDKQKIPSIGMRQIGSLVRLAEASARACHRNIVQVKDAMRACEIVRFSIMNSGFNPITKNAVAKEIDTSTMMKGKPLVREIDVMKLAGREKDRFFDNARRKVTKFERVMKRMAISKCLYCKGKGVQLIDGVEKNCNECQGFGSVNTQFMLSDVEEALRPLGFTRNDVEDIANNIFVKVGLLQKDEFERFQATQRYSFKKGWAGIKMLEMNLEIAMDLEGNFKKLEMMEAGLSDADRQRLLSKVREDLSK